MNQTQLKWTWKRTHLMGALTVLLLQGVVGGGGEARAQAVRSATAPLAPSLAGGNWTPTGSLSSGRYGHTATLLADGRVLVAGGYILRGEVIASAELYDPATGTWSATSPMRQVRANAMATLLPDGRVLMVGGYGNGILASAELYDPATGTWTATGSMASGRSSLSATLLPDGRVLVTGGYSGSSGDLSSAELYDPVTGTWSAALPMSRPRHGHPATLLADGRVLVAGGRNNNVQEASAELYDPATGTWSDTESMNQARGLTTGTLLADGRVLLAGGYSRVPILISELYDPATGTWSTSGSMVRIRDYFTATLLPDGRVLVAGGSSDASAELYDPATGTWSATGSMTQAREFHSATLLADGRVLVAGGSNNGDPEARAELYPKRPDTRLGSAPPPVTRQREALFTFTSDDADTRFECRLGDEPFSECTSPVTYADLAEGPYTFRVRARDPFGNVDATPASHSWTVDLTTPATTLLAVPANPSQQAGATFAFESSEAGARFECSLDGAPFSTCTSPATFSGLGERTHTFQVRSRDAAGNVESPPASYAWEVDLTAPVTRITSAPEHPSNQATATFTFESDEAGVTFECSLDGAPYSPCVSPSAFSGLSEDAHSFQVRARDGAGNVDATPASHSWTVAQPVLEAPVITSPRLGAILDDATPVFSGSARPGSTVTITVNGVDLGITAASETGVWSFTATSPLAEGTHTVTATARDSGVTSPASAAVSFTIDLATEQPTEPGGEGGCSAGPGESSWLLASLALLAVAASRRRRLAR